MISETTHTYAVEVNGLLYTIPGNNTSGVETYNVVTNTWTNVAPALIDQPLGTAASINGEIYVIGGCANSDCNAGITNANSRFDTVSNTWASMAPMPTARRGAAAGAINGKLYVAGGFTFCSPVCNATPNLEVYDPTADAWSVKASMPTALGQSGAAVINGKLYIAGGTSTAQGSHALPILQIYDPTTDTWTTGASMSAARYALGAGVVNGILYAVSGADASDAAVTTVEAYDPGSDSWTPVSPIPTARYEEFPVTLNGVVYAAGDEFGARSGVLEAFTPSSAATPTWRQLSPTGGPPPGRNEHSAVYDANTDTMMVFGGRTGSSGDFNDTWLLTSADGLGGTSTWIPLSTSGGPPSARIEHSAVYDPGSNRMIVFGGSFSGAGCGQSFNDTWLLSNANGSGGPAVWTQLTPVGPLPPSRAGHTAVYNPNSNRMIIYGGTMPCGNLPDVWVLQNANGNGGPPSWTQLHPSGGPSPGLYGASAVYDVANNLMIVYGGSNAAALPNNVWVLTNADGTGGAQTWIVLSPTGTPPAPRFLHTAVYDPGTNRMIVFGGLTQAANPTVNDTWVLANANGIGGSPSWTQLSPSGNLPATRSSHTATYNSGTNRMVVFGGVENCYATCVAGNDTWVLGVATGVPPNSPPTANAGSDQTVEATSPAGAVVALDAGASTDPDGDTLTFTWTGPFGTSSGQAVSPTLPLGTSTITLTVDDGHGNTATARVHVNVVDTTPPALSLPSNITAEASGPSGAAVSFSATASDLVDGPVAVDCTPASGSTFAIGTATVNCSATDAHGNSATGSFNVAVRDTTPPVLALPGNITAEPTGPGGAAVSFSATATDLVDGPVAVSCIPASGSTFALATTTVHCSATDAHGNTATGSFTVIVRDTTAPTLVLPGNLAVNATSPSGANVNYSVSATDLVDPNPSVSCVPASGAAFSTGTTAVNCSATDFSGNVSHGTFMVTVYGAAAQVDNLVALVNSILAVNAQQGIENSLDAKLQNALAAIDSLKANSVPTAVNQLNAFINEVQAQSGKVITTDQANQLIAAANQIKAALGA